MFVVLRSPLGRVVGWTLLCGTAVLAMWPTLQRPTNRYAERVTLEPLQSDYGPVYLSGAASVGVVVVKGPGDGWVMTLSPPAYVRIGEESATRDEHSGLPDEAELARGLLGRPPTPAERPGLQELRDIIADARSGWRTDVREFRLVEASPWEGRRAAWRWLTLTVLAWLTGCGLLWRWPAA